MFGNFMGWLLGTKKGARDHIVNLRLTVRRLERAQRKLGRDESKMQLKMKQNIQRGDLESARLFATDMFEIEDGNLVIRNSYQELMG